MAEFRLKGNLVKRMFLFVIGSAFSLSAFAQINTQATVVVESAGPASSYHVVVISRTVQAVDYLHRGGATDVDLAGTTLMSSANGKVKVRSKRGTMEVEAEFGNLESPTTFGNEYLTYVLWAISPEGRAENLGEVLVGSNDRSKLTATTNLQAFALIVTAEPYFGVRQPSNVVILENVVRSDTKGSSEAVSTKYELMERGGYLPTGYKFDPVVLSVNLPLEFYEARNAMRIAKSEGAEQYAGESYQHAIESMKTADDYAVRKHVEAKPLIAAARQTVQTAEDAREIAVKRIEADNQTAERLASSAAQARSQAEADNADRLKRKAEYDAARAQADAANSQAQADDANRLKQKAQNDASMAQADAANSQAAMVTSQNASAAAVTAAQADADRSRLLAQQAQDGQNKADSEKAAMRAQLSEQLNKILETRDSARGLIVSMSDVLFDTGHYSLKPGAREKLAKVAGILIAYPGLNIAVGGYTDNVGGDEMNQKLSENRASSVRDYLVAQGVGASTVGATGFGNSSPVASNDNASGRQENRRVELVVSGDAIGSPVNATVGSLR
jgi:outer membrane protein OmpA-like peptidoglycan-associated protein